jgi:putative DNA primase/helicase
MEEFISMEIPAREMVLDPILPAQGPILLNSKRGVRKTYLSLGIALGVATGGTFLRWSAPKPRRVLFVDGELPANTLQQRIASIRAGMLGPDPLDAVEGYLRIITPDMQRQPMPDLSAIEGQALLEREIADAQLLVLDNLSALCRSGKENEGESWLPVQAWMLRLRQRGLSVLLVHRESQEHSEAHHAAKTCWIRSLHFSTPRITQQAMGCVVKFSTRRHAAFSVRMPDPSRSAWS